MNQRPQNSLEALAAELLKDIRPEWTDKQLDIAVPVFVDSMVNADSDKPLTPEESIAFIAKLDALVATE